MSEKMTIRALRVNKGKTQEECANALGISKPSYIAKEKNIERFRFMEICALSDFLGYPVETFKEAI